MISQWTPDAQYTYEEVIDYLFENWTKKEIKNFNKKVFKTIEQIELNPFMYPTAEENLNIRKAKVSKQTSLFYSIEKDFISLLFFWNEYKDPKSLEELLSFYL